MQPENAIEVRDLTKKFKVFYDKGNQLKEKILFHNRNLRLWKKYHIKITDENNLSGQRNH